MELKNRIIMTALTRTRCDANAVPSEIMIAYYRQRASAGLIIAEVTTLSPNGLEYPKYTGYLD